MGDKIRGSNGDSVVVTHVFDSYVPKDMYELTMNDGQTIKCSGNHLWYCETDNDYLEKKEYKKLAKHYFKQNKIPNYEASLPAYPYSIIGSKFSSDKQSQDFIQRVCLSLGPTYQTPNVLFDGLDYIDEQKVYSYSYNDIIDSLKNLYNVIHHKKGYFYYGQVRTAKMIAELINDGNSVNIPETTDIKNHFNLI